MDTHDLASAAELVLRRREEHDNATAALCEALEDWQSQVSSHELGVVNAYQAGREQMAYEVLVLLKDRLSAIRSSSLAGLQLRSLIEEIKNMK